MPQINMPMGYHVRHLTLMIETFELLIKSCTKFDLLFVNIHCATACSLEKVNFKV